MDWHTLASLPLKHIATSLELDEPFPGDDGLPHEAGDDTDGDLAPRRILVVDDDTDLLESLRDVLELDDGFAVSTAIDATSALECASRELPHVALIDVKLGTEDGLDLVEMLKQRLPSLVCIAMTAFRDEQYARRAMRCGANLFLYKPLEPDALLRTLRQLPGEDD
ncbi:MAG: response regulator [Pseudomonadota bacterium]